MCHCVCQLLTLRDSRCVACGDMSTLGELVPGVTEDCSDSCRRSSYDLYFSNSDISSPSRRPSAVSKNHICFLTKCTTMVPPIRAPSYLLLLPSRCVQAYSGATGRPDLESARDPKEKDHTYLREASTFHFLLRELQHCIPWKDQGQGEYSGL